jgi:hypothetical protein
MGRARVGASMPRRTVGHAGQRSGSRAPRLRRGYSDAWRGYRSVACPGQNSLGHDDHAGAVKIVRDIADQIGLDNPIKRAFAMREAAISAASTNDWRQAEIWFADGQTAAAAAHTVDVQAMAIGLGADVAVAALNNGLRNRALERLAESLGALGNLDL